MHKFTYKHIHSKTSVTLEVDEDANLTEIIEAFEDYLRGCSYQIDGKIVYEKNGE